MKRSRWKLTPEAFNSLIERLSRDREEAAAEFESLRRYLIAILTYAGGADPEHLADTALDRAAKRLAAGEAIENLRAWLRGAARKVLQESRLETNREQVAARATPYEPSAAEAEADHRLLEECLDLLSAQNRLFIERYYEADGESLPSVRKKLAARFGVTQQALRTRALRLRKVLEKCLEERRSGA